MKKTNIRDVARMAGVSPATVSRAINGTGTVTEETKQRIAEAIRNSGYQLGEAAETEMITGGFVYFIMKCASINVYSRLLLHNLVLAAKSKGVSIVAADLEQPLLLTEADISFHLQQAQRIGARGLILSGYTDMRTEANAMELLNNSNLPIVSISRSMFQSKLSFNHILTGSDRGSYLATVHLLDKGRKHLLMAYLPNHKGNVYGFEAAIRDYGTCDVHTQILLAEKESPEASEALLITALEADPELDGVLCCTDELAAHFLQALRKAGKQVPSEVELIGYNDNLAPFLNPPISSVHVPLDEIAEQALDLILDNRQTRTEASVKSILLEPKLVIR